MGRLRVQEEKEAWIEEGEEREEGGECKRPEGAAALHNQIPRWCSRMRSTLSAVRRKSGAGGSRGHASTPKNALPPFPPLARSQGHPSPKSFNRTPRGIPGINRKHLLAFRDWWPREIPVSRDVARGDDRREEENRLGEIFHSKGPRDFRRVWGFYFVVQRRGVTSRVTKNDVLCKVWWIFLLKKERMWYLLVFRCVSRLELEFGLY